MHNQPEAPLPSEEVTTRVGKKKQAEGPAAPSPPPAAPLNPGEDENNVGNKLLKMMGWKEGTGLGTGGEGRVEPMLVFVIFSRGDGGLCFDTQTDGDICTRGGAWSE
jgi:RNA-binding protein 5/10